MKLFDLVTFRWVLTHCSLKESFMEIEGIKKKKLKAFGKLKLHIF